MTPDEVRAAAESLRAAEAAADPVAPLSETWPEMTVADAYAIQLANIDDRIANGDRIRGHKVGLTSRAMQEMLGVSEPDYGHLLGSMLVAEGSELSAASFCHVRVEPEIAFFLGETLQGPGVTAADVLRATDFVMPAIEVIDSRVRDWNIRLVDTIADNGSSARAVAGGRATLVSEIDLRLLGVTMRRNGEIQTTGCSGAVLGNPTLAVAWLANALGRLPAGEMIMPGSCTRAIDVRSGDHVRVDFDALGHVSVSFA